MQAALLVALLVLGELTWLTTAPSAIAGCRWPGTATGNTSCAPLGASLAPDSVSVSVTGTPSLVYTDVVPFSYGDAPLHWPKAPHRDEPGRRIKVAAADIRDWNQPWCFKNGTCASQGPRGGGSAADVTVAKNMKRALAIVDAAGNAGADVVQLPEEFKYSWVTNDHSMCPQGVCAEPLRGETYQILRSKAIKYRMYIVYGTRENATESQAVYNTAVVLDRKGDIVGTYRKVFPFSGPNNHPGLWASPNGTTVVDLDFGRAAFLTCFDVRRSSSFFPPRFLRCNRAARVCSLDWANG